jgi:hypothetical protein
MILRDLFNTPPTNLPTCAAQAGRPPSRTSGSACHMVEALSRSITWMVQGGEIGGVGGG